MRAKGQKKVRDLMMFMKSYCEVYSYHINQNSFVYNKQPKQIAFKPDKSIKKFKSVCEVGGGNLLTHVIRKLKNILASGIGESR